MACARLFVAGGALVLCSLSNSSWAGRPMYAADLFFEKSVDQMNGELLGQMQALRCKIGTRKVEIAVVVGHASNDESDAARLSQARARAVAVWMEEQAQWKVHAEGKGAHQPVADNKTEGGRRKNRRVEMELVLHGDGRALSEDCQPEWVQRLFASDRTAPTVAHALVTQQDLPAGAPFRAALSAKRLDIFDALVAKSNISMRSEDQEDLARRALDSGRINYFIRWATGRRKDAVRSDGEQSLMQRVCTSYASADDKVLAVDALYKVDLRVKSPDTLLCAVKSVGDLGLLNAYLRAGGTPHVSPDVVVASGARPALLERLLALGADPAARDAQGATLFHTVRLQHPADVQRLLDWGLDINAKGRLHTPSNPETTPLREAVVYATPDVLAFMRAHGARADGIRLVDDAGRNPAALAWLIQGGWDVTAKDVVRLADLSAGSTEVFSVLRDRGVDLGAKDEDGVTALAVAIRRFNVELVRLLVQSGVSLGPMKVHRTRESQSALTIAEHLSAGFPPLSCAGCTPPSVSSQLSPEYEQRKQEMIEIIRSAMPSP